MHARTWFRVPSRAHRVGSSFACPLPADLRTRTCPASGLSSFCALYTCRDEAATTTSLVPALNFKSISSMAAASSVPQEVLGLAIFVDCLSLIATVLGLLLCFMLWNHGERVSCKLRALFSSTPPPKLTGPDILMLSACTTFGAIVGLIRHVDYTLNWRDIQEERFEHEQHFSYSQSDMFRKADVGWRLVLSWICMAPCAPRSLPCINASLQQYSPTTSMLFLSCSGQCCRFPLRHSFSILMPLRSIALFIGTWDIRMKTSSKKIMSAVFKTSAIVLPIAMCVVCSNDAIQQIPVAYLVLFNFISKFQVRGSTTNAILTISTVAICLTTGSLLVIVVLLKYLQSRNLFTRFFPRSTGKSPSLGGGTMSSVATTRTQTGTDKWLIVRFSIIMICLL